MKKFIFFILLVGLVFSCKKKQTIHITAKNVVTGKPYSGLYYTVTRVKTGLFESNYKTVAEGTLNENGEAYVTKRLTKNASFDVSIQDPGNICYVNKPSFTFADGDNFEANFEFAECSYLTISVNNVNCQGSSDKIIFDMQPKYIANYGLISPTEKTGCYSNTFIESTVACGPWEATWEVTKNNVTTNHDTSFYMNEYEHFHLIINY